MASSSTPHELPPRRRGARREPDPLPRQERSAEGSLATDGGPPPRLPPRKRAFRNGNRPYPLRLERSASHTHISAVAKQVCKRVAIATPDRSTRSPAPTYPLHPPAQLCALQSASDAQSLVHKHHPSKKRQPTARTNTHRHPRLS